MWRFVRFFVSIVHSFFVTGQDDSNRSYFSQAMICVASMLKQKIISNPTDLNAIVLYNSKAQNNENDFKGSALPSQPYNDRLYHLSIPLLPGVHVFMDLDETTAHKIKEVTHHPPTSFAFQYTTCCTDTVQVQRLADEPDYFEVCSSIKPQRHAIQNSNYRNTTPRQKKKLTTNQQPQQQYTIQTNKRTKK